MAGYPLQLGVYVVTASDNLPVESTEWVAYGGSVSVAISDTPGGIDVTLVGPRAEIPGVPAPYSLMVSDGETQYPAFSVTGSGVFTDPETLSVLTGADENKTSVEVAQEIDNFFIIDLEQAYDRVVWAATLASGPVITLTATIPATAVSSFGLGAGSLVSYKSSIYRVVTCNITNGTATITATPYVTTADVDALWTTDDTGDWDGYWGSNETLDQKIKPLRHP